MKITDKIHEGVFDVIKEKPDIMIISCPFNEKLSYFERLNVIFIKNRLNTKNNLNFKEIDELIHFKDDDLFE